MALGAALKDRARVVSDTPLPTKVEGKTILASVPSIGSWFRARLELPSGPESEGPGARRRAVTAPTLMYGVKDSEGNPLHVNIRDRIEVDSVQLGTEIWEVTADPAPIRKKRTLLGWTANLQRVDDHEFVERLA